jgi:crossover junction endodeoxyribonuclease RuvC
VTTVIGIDPGVNGALALVIEGQLHTVVDMPTFEVTKNGKKSQVVNAYELTSILSEWESFGIWPGGRVVIESIGAMPKQGVATMFAMGRNYGTVEGVVCALDLPISYTRPNEWKKRAGLLRQDKGASRRLATQTWPKHSDDFRLVKHDGRAEAALIAVYGVTPPSQDEPNDR